MMTEEQRALMAALTAIAAAAALIDRHATPMSQGQADAIAWQITALVEHAVEKPRLNS